MQNPDITKRPNATRPMIGATNFSIPIPPGCWSMSTASSVKNNAARRHTIPPSMRRLIAIMEVSASLGTTSLAVVPPRAYPTGEELGSHRRDYGRLVVALEIERDSEIVLISAQTGQVKMAPKPLLR
jgi:hypothetical protein